MIRCRRPSGRLGDSSGSGWRLSRILVCVALSACAWPACSASNPHPPPALPGQEPEQAAHPSVVDERATFAVGETTRGIEGTLLRGTMKTERSGPVAIPIDGAWIAEPGAAAAPPARLSVPAVGVVAGGKCTMIQKKAILSDSGALSLAAPRAGEAASEPPSVTLRKVNGTFLLDLEGSTREVCLLVDASGQDDLKVLAFAEPPPAPAPSQPKEEAPATTGGAPGEPSAPGATGAADETKVAPPPKTPVAGEGARGDGSPSPASSDAPGTAADTWTAYRGETKCSGMKVEVSFSYNEQRQQIRDFVLQDSCVTPQERGGGHMTWKGSEGPTAAAKGRFTVTEPSRSIGAHTTIQLGDAFQASGRVDRRRASGTSNAHVALECKGRRVLKNCRTWTASAAAESGAAAASSGAAGSTEK